MQFLIDQPEAVALLPVHLQIFNSAPPAPTIWEGPIEGGGFDYDSDFGNIESY